MRDAGIQQVMDQLPEHFIRVMRNWVRANSGVNVLRISNVYSGAARDTFDGAALPILMGEAKDVDLALVEIPIRERAAVTLFWQYEGATLPWLSDRLVVDYRTVKARIIKGNELLQAELHKLRRRMSAVAAANAQAVVDSGRNVGLESRM
jgi:DNA-directed RNA polymerase specialized sigma24 family protein